MNQYQTDIYDWFKGSYVNISSINEIIKSYEAK